MTSAQQMIRLTRDLMARLKLENVKYAVGTNNSTVEQLMVVMRERTTFLESEQHY